MPAHQAYASGQEGPSHDQVGNCLAGNPICLVVVTLQAYPWSHQKRQAQSGRSGIARSIQEVVRFARARHVRPTQFLPPRFTHSARLSVKTDWLATPLPCPLRNLD